MEKFLYRTNSHPRFNYKENSYMLDEYLLGFGNWRNASANSIRPEVQRYLILALDFTSIQKSLGWSEAELTLLSTKDMCLFYNCLFFYPGAFAVVYLILLKQ